MGQHAHLYQTNAWRKRRKQQLTAEPLCRYCVEQGRTVAGTVADHMEPHRGNETAFFQGELQTLCATHHSATKHKEERTGRVVGCDVDGHPIDPNHHWNG